MRAVQPDLFGRIEDEVGELGESEKEFVRICTTALNSGRFAKYRDKGGRTVGIVDATTRRYFVRSGIERVFSHLHEVHGGKFVRVRGSKKVFLHLMLGLIVVTAEQIFSAAVLS